nr:polysaccharide deacetylase family protein [Clostridium sp. DJ247]
MKREIAEGNVVGNHTCSHQLNYKEGPENFVQDLNRCDAVLKPIIGNNYNLKLIRFPGGSFGARLKPFRESVTKVDVFYFNSK